MAEETTTSANILAKKIAEGSASREERGLTLKMINTQLAIEYVTGLDGVKSFVERMKELRGKMSEKFIEKIEKQLEADEIEPEVMFQYLTAISNKEMQLVAEYRKLLQGNRQLFDEDAMSEQERIVVRLLRSIGSPDQKSDFINIVKEYMQDKNMQDAHIVE